MRPFKESVIIARSSQAVYEYLAENENEIEWQTGLVESKRTSPGPLAVGSTGRDIRRSMGIRSVAEWVVTGLEPGKAFDFQVTKPMPFAAHYRLEEVPQGTRVTMTAVPTSGMTKLIWPIVRIMGSKQYSEDFASLKRVLEERG